MEQNIYCSLDIETSGFDPETSEVLEVGFAFFSVGPQGIKITEEWTQVFKPARAVEAKILGLTGIKAEEMESAPKFSEHREFLQNKLGEVTIVGHNIGFDLRFLEAFGLKFSGRQVDTLDLVQWLLPTHQGYNLESVMHYFKISHKEAHRALADAKACIAALEKLLEVFGSLKPATQKKILRMAEGKFAWADMLSYAPQGVPLVATDKNASGKKPEGFFKAEDEKIYLADLGVDPSQAAAQAAVLAKEKSLVVVPNLAKVFEMWKNGEAEALLPASAILDGKKFEAFARSKTISDEELRFVFKVLVWKETNWQTKSLLDLNLTFSGGQFRQAVSKSGKTRLPAGKVLVCDMKTFCETASPSLKSRVLILAGMNEFENQASSNISRRVSYGGIVYLLKSFYNPETGTGHPKYETVVKNTLAKTDLFFGLTGALLGTGEEEYETVKITEEVSKNERFHKLASAAANFAEVLEEANKKLRSLEIKSIISDLLEFFEEQTNRVKWVEISRERCTYFSSPVAIDGIVKKLLEGYKASCFFDNVNIPAVGRYLKVRLGISTWQEVKQTDVVRIQTELSFEDKVNPTVDYSCESSLMTKEKIFESLNQGSLPAAVVFATPSVLAEFHETYFLKLEKFAALSIQNGSGGSSKMLRNFSINNNGLLMATDKFLLKALKNNIAAEALPKLAVKTLFLTKLPFEIFTHPYAEAVAGLFEDPFSQFSLPRAVLNFHNLLNLFYTPELKLVRVCDPKLGKEYARAFVEYLKLWKNFRLVGS